MQRQHSGKSSKLSKICFSQKLPITSNKRPNHHAENDKSKLGKRLQMAEFFLFQLFCKNTLLSFENLFSSALHDSRLLIQFGYVIDIYAINRVV